MASTFEKGDLLLSVAISYVHDFQDAPISLLICIFIPFEGKNTSTVDDCNENLALSRLCYRSFHSIQHNLHSW